MPLFDKTPDNGATGAEVDLASITEETAMKLLVGEEGKYKTPEALAKASFFREAHVRKLEKELADLKATTSQQMTISDLIAKLEKPPVTQTPEQKDPKVDEKNMTGTIDIQTEVQKLVAAELAKMNGKTAKEQNLAKVTETLKENWGPGYETILSQKASQLGASQDYLVELAATNPALFLSAVGATEKKTNGGLTPPRTQVNTGGNPGNTGVKNNKYYQDMRKKDPRTFNSPAVQRERFEQAAKLGDAFFT